ncbi:MAG: acyl-CoA dehydrogenase family protein [Planctomycetes bacterium]|nr:acyl-CoA dehydrogenase family protein [Planctomycetota bacterium]
MRNYQGVDFYVLDDLLSEEERLIRDTTREWVSANVVPIIAEQCRIGTFPRALISSMGELGVFGANLSGYGCAGVGPVAYGLMMQELERGDSGVRSCASVQGSLVMFPIHAYGTEEQKQRWLPAMAKGEAIGCFGLTEPDHGSDPGGMETRATKKGGEWVVNGAKMWITNGTIADVAVVWAQTEDGIQGFLIEKGTPGYSAPEMKGKLSLRASVTSELVMQDVVIPDKNRLPGVKGLKGPLSCLTQARYGIVWGALGAAMACYDEALHYAKSRIQFGKPIAGFQLVQAKLAEVVTEITKGQLLAWRLGRLKEAGKATHSQVSMAKRNNVGWALDIARTCRDMLGANGILDEYQTMRHMVNLESVNTYEGTWDIHTLAIGEAVTGIPAYR